MPGKNRSDSSPNVADARPRTASVVERNVLDAFSTYKRGLASSSSNANSNVNNSTMLGNLSSAAGGTNATTAVANSNTSANPAQAQRLASIFAALPHPSTIKLTDEELASIAEFYENELSGGGGSKSAGGAISGVGGGGGLSLGVDAVASSSSSLSDPERLRTALRRGLNIQVDSFTMRELYRRYHTYKGGGGARGIVNPHQLRTVSSLAMMMAGHHQHSHQQQQQQHHHTSSHKINMRGGPRRKVPPLPTSSARGVGGGMVDETIKMVSSDDDERDSPRSSNSNDKKKAATASARGRTASPLPTSSSSSPRQHRHQQHHSSPLNMNSKSNSPTQQQFHACDGGSHISCEALVSICTVVKALAVTAERERMLMRIHGLRDSSAAIDANVNTTNNTNMNNSVVGNSSSWRRGSLSSSPPPYSDYDLYSALHSDGGGGEDRQRRTMATMAMPTTATTVYAGGVAAKTLDASRLLEADVKESLAEHQPPPIPIETYAKLTSQREKQKIVNLATSGHVSGVPLAIPMSVQTLRHASMTTADSFANGVGGAPLSVASPSSAAGSPHSPAMMNSTNSSDSPSALRRFLGGIQIKNSDGTIMQKPRELTAAEAKQLAPYINFSEDIKGVGYCRYADDADDDVESKGNVTFALSSTKNNGDDDDDAFSANAMVAMNTSRLAALSAEFGLEAIENDPFLHVDIATVAESEVVTSLLRKMNAIARREEALKAVMRRQQQAQEDAAALADATASSPTSPLVPNSTQTLLSSGDGKAASTNAIRMFAVTKVLSSFFGTDEEEEAAERGGAAASQRLPPPTTTTLSSAGGEPTPSQASKKADNSRAISGGGGAVPNLSVSALLEGTKKNDTINPNTNTSITTANTTSTSKTQRLNAFGLLTDPLLYAKLSDDDIRELTALGGGGGGKQSPLKRLSRPATAENTSSASSAPLPLRPLVNTFLSRQQDEKLYAARLEQGAVNGTSSSSASAAPTATAAGKSAAGLLPLPSSSSASSAAAAHNNRAELIEDTRLLRSLLYGEGYYDDTIPDADGDAASNGGEGGIDGEGGGGAMSEVMAVKMLTAAREQRVAKGIARKLRARAAAGLLGARAGSFGGGGAEPFASSENHHNNTKNTSSSSMAGIHQQLQQKQAASSGGGGGDISDEMMKAIERKAAIQEALFMTPSKRQLVAEIIRKEQQEAIAAEQVALQKRREAARIKNASLSARQIQDRETIRALRSRRKSHQHLQLSQQPSPMNSSLGGGGGGGVGNATSSSADFGASRNGAEKQAVPLTLDEGGEDDDDEDEADDDVLLLAGDLANGGVGGKKPNFSSNHNRRRYSSSSSFGTNAAAAAAAASNHHRGSTTAASSATTPPQSSSSAAGGGGGGGGGAANAFLTADEIAALRRIEDERLKDDHPLYSALKDIIERYVERQRRAEESAGLITQAHASSHSSVPSSLSTSAAVAGGGGSGGGSGGNAIAPNTSSAQQLASSFSPPPITITLLSKSGVETTRSAAGFATAAGHKKSFVGLPNTTTVANKKDDKTEAAAVGRPLTADPHHQRGGRGHNSSASEGGGGVVESSLYESLSAHLLAKDREATILSDYGAEGGGEGGVGGAVESLYRPATPHNNSNSMPLGDENTTTNNTSGGGSSIRGGGGRASPFPATTVASPHPAAAAIHLSVSNQKDMQPYGIQRPPHGGTSTQNTERWDALHSQEHTRVVLANAKREIDEAQKKRLVTAFEVCDMPYETFIYTPQLRKRPKQVPTFFHKSFASSFAQSSSSSHHNQTKDHHHSDDEDHHHTTSPQQGVLNRSAPPRLFSAQQHSGNSFNVSSSNALPPKQGSSAANINTSSAYTSPSSLILARKLPYLTKTVAEAQKEAPLVGHDHKVFAHPFIAMASSATTTTTPTRLSAPLPSSSTARLSSAGHMSDDAGGHFSAQHTSHSNHHHDLRQPHHYGHHAAMKKKAESVAAAKEAREAAHQQLLREGKLMASPLNTTAQNHQDNNTATTNTTTISSSSSHQFNKTITLQNTRTVTGQSLKAKAAELSGIGLNTTTKNAPRHTIPAYSAEELHISRVTMATGAIPNTSSTAAFANNGRRNSEEDAAVTFSSESEGEAGDKEEDGSHRSAMRAKKNRRKHRNQKKTNSPPPSPSTLALVEGGPIKGTGPSISMHERHNHHSVTEGGRDVPSSSHDAFYDRRLRRTSQLLNDEYGVVVDGGRGGGGGGGVSKEKEKGNGEGNRHRRSISQRQWEAEAVAKSDRYTNNSPLSMRFNNGGTNANAAPFTTTTTTTATNNKSSSNSQRQHHHHHEEKKDHHPHPHRRLFSTFAPLGRTEVELRLKENHAALQRLVKESMVTLDASLRQHQTEARLRSGGGQRGGGREGVGSSGEENEKGEGENSDDASPFSDPPPPSASGERAQSPNASKHHRNYSGNGSALHHSKMFIANPTITKHSTPSLVQDHPWDYSSQPGKVGVSISSALHFALNGSKGYCEDDTSPIGGVRENSNERRIRLKREAERRFRERQHKASPQRLRALSQPRSYRKQEKVDKTDWSDVSVRDRSAKQKQRKSGTATHNSGGVTTTTAAPQKPGAGHSGADKSPPSNKEEEEEEGALSLAELTSQNASPNHPSNSNRHDAGAGDNGGGDHDASILSPISSPSAGSQTPSPPSSSSSSHPPHHHSQQQQHGDDNASSPLVFFDDDQKNEKDADDTA